MGNKRSKPILDNDDDCDERMMFRTMMDQPITDKQTERQNYDGFTWGVSSMQGWRVSMEDSHIAQPLSNLKHHYLLCVMDGHGGTFAGEFCSQQFLNILDQQKAFQKYRKMRILQESSLNQGTLEQFKEILKEALEDAFCKLDRTLLKTMISKGIYQPPTNQSRQNSFKQHQKNGFSDEPESASGTTMTAVLVTPEWVLCANAGDSRAILSCEGMLILPLSQDHKPTIPEELERIERANGSVLFDRVDGQLAVSRAIGDFEFKDYRETEKSFSIQTIAKSLKVSPFPQVISEPRDDENQLVVVACDGIFDVLTNEECIRQIETLFHEGESDLGLIAEEMLDICLNKGSRDNMTIIVAMFPGDHFLVTGDGGVTKRRKQRENTRSNQS